MRVALFAAVFFVSLIVFAVRRHDVAPHNSMSETDLQTRRILFKLVNCTPPAVEDFPSDLFTEQQRLNGAIILHFLATIYMFLGLAFVCDEYFVPCLDIACVKFKIQEDVAGATLMAAGSSVPDLAITLIAAFIVENDVGLGATIGGTVLNILLVPAVCALGAGMVVYLNWWPILRDSAFYMLSIVILVLTIYDGVVHWYEALAFVVVYGVFVLMMAYNRVIERWVKSWCTCFVVPEQWYEQQQSHQQAESGANDQDLVWNSCATAGEPACGMKTLRPLRQTAKLAMCDDSAGYINPICVIEEESLAIGATNAAYQATTPQETPKTQRPIRPSVGKTVSTVSTISVNTEVSTTDADRNGTGAANAASYVTADTTNSADSQNHTDKRDVRRRAVDVFVVPHGCFKRFLYFFGLPLTALLFISVPDCRVPRFRNLFWLTFISSTLWIAGLAYVMVWMIVIIGATFNIPDSLMGVTFVGFGASAADFITSVIVARQGKGDMAICNALGSNIFCVLVCLGVPWLFKAIVDGEARNDGIQVFSVGLMYSTAILMVAVLIFFSICGLNHWKLDKKFGVIMLVFYCVFMALVCLYELNIFAYVNPPNCPLMTL